MLSAFALFASKFSICKWCRISSARLVGKLYVPSKHDLLPLRMAPVTLGLWAWCLVSVWLGDGVITTDFPEGSPTSLCAARVWLGIRPAVLDSRQCGQTNMAKLRGTFLQL
jgi:hypothetical protein